MTRSKRALQEGGVNFCYSDESGTGDEPIATMVGIVVDALRMHVTKSDWVELLESLSGLTGRNIAELHTANFYNGNGVWRQLIGSVRSQVTTAILDWLTARKHQIVYASLYKTTYFEALEAQEIPEELNTPWRFLAFHLALAVQKYSQPEPKNKGNTILVFDNEYREETRFIDLVLNPPEWSDEYYVRKKKSSQLDQIVDVPYFHDSKHLPLLQVADFLAFYLRRYAELQEGVGPPVKFPEEVEKIGACIAQLKQCAIAPSNIYPKRQRSEAQDLFYRHAPASVRDL